jgi:hypothetical protein
MSAVAYRNSALGCGVSLTSAVECFYRAMIIPPTETAKENAVLIPRFLIERMSDRGEGRLRLSGCR